MRSKIILFSIFMFICTFSVLAVDKYEYYYLSFSEINISKGSFPVYKETKKEKRNWKKRLRLRRIKNYIQPYVVGKNEEEIYIKSTRDWTSNPLKMNIKKLYLAIKTKKGKTPSGSIFFINQDMKKMDKVEFKILKSNPDLKNRNLFYKTKVTYYKKLLSMRIPGAAWFRYNINQATYAISGSKKSASNTRIRRGLPFTNRTSLQDTYSLFSGGRALSENLQLDRTLSIVSPENPTIPINTIKGITVSEFNWKDHIDGIKPEKDKLSKYIPFDQYAVFFKSFDSMVDLIDEMDFRGTPILKFLEPRSEDMYSKKKYQKQLCLPIDILSRIFGPSVINGIAFTGSDPYMRTGTDISLIFDSKNTELLKKTILFHYGNSIKNNNNCKKVKGEILGVKYSGVKTSNRVISSYMVILDKNTVAVSNSIVQIKKIIKSFKGKIRSIYSSDEYTYFRHRYKKSDKDESALMLISDAFIRKICSPKYRIADSRRTRAAAVLSDLKAEYIHKNIYTGKRKKWLSDKKIPGMGKLSLTKWGISSSIYGNLEFLTPISELIINKVTKSEVKAYERFRNNYQNHWRKYFDPIAIRFYIDSKKIGIDMTVWPLIKQSDYRNFMEITKNSAIKKYSGDIHSDSILQYIMSLDPESKTMKKIGNFALGFAPALGGNVFNWIGNWISFYIDDSNFWKDLKLVTENDKNAASKFFKNNIYRFPAAIIIEVNNSLKLSLFLTSLRSYINQTAPGLTNWETRKFNGFPYICISAKKYNSNSAENNFQIFYAATPKLLIFSLSEEIIKKSLKRINKKRDNSLQNSKPWLGKSFGLKLNRSFLDVIDIFYNINVREIYEIKSWSNIIILNEWKKLNDKISPQLFHTNFWKSKLVCPGGGKYIWNKKYQTMESTVFGFPGQNKAHIEFANPLKTIESLEFGITFEGDGLRARGELVRRSK